MITEEQKKKFHMPCMNNGNELIFAARANDLEAVKYLMNTEFEYFSRVEGYKKQQALILAANDGHLDIVKYLLDDDFKTDIDIKRTCSEALRSAIREGSVNSVEFLLTDAKTKDYTYLDCMYCFKLAPKHMLEYLVFEYKMEISPYIERIKSDSYLMMDRSKKYVPEILNNYEKFIQAKEMHDSLQNELDNGKDNTKKIKI